MPDDDGSFGAVALAAADAGHAERCGALYLGMAMLRPDFPTLVGDLIAQAAELADPEALALLLAMRSVAPEGDVRRAVADAVSRLEAAGLPAPPWAEELAEPVRAGEFGSVPSRDGRAALLVGTFVRAEATHFVAVLTDQEHGGIAWLVDAGRCPDSRTRAPGAPGRTPMNPAEFRRRVEAALRMRQAYAELGLDEELSEWERVDFAAQALLVRARLSMLPS